MLEELLDILAHPDEYECCWHEGELYLRKRAEEPKPTEEVKLREPEPA